MVTAIDTSVLLDFLCNSPGQGEQAETALREAAHQGQLIICECVVAELRPALSDDDLFQFLKDWTITFVPSSVESSLLAGKMYESYLKRRGSAVRVIPDFLIGAHALTFAERLLARDRGYWRDYFKTLHVVAP